MTFPVQLTDEQRDDFPAVWTELPRAFVEIHRAPLSGYRGGAATTSKGE